MSAWKIKIYFFFKLSETTKCIVLRQGKQNGREILLRASSSSFDDKKRQSPIIQHCTIILAMTGQNE